MSSFVSVALALLTIGGAGFTWWLAAHPQALAQSGLWIALGMLVFLGCGTALLLLALRWRARRAVQAAPIGRCTHASGPLHDDPADLQPDVTYRVCRALTDHHGQRFAVGERLTFRQRHFLPYHGGHTLVFVERSMFLQEEQQRDVLAHLARYLQPETLPSGSVSAH